MLIPLANPVSDPVLIFAIVMLVILIAPLAMRRIRMPGIAGVLIAGAMLGPHGLNVLHRDETIILLGTVGLLYLMYLAGLGLDLNQFAKLRNRSIVFGIISYTIPALIAWAFGHWLLDYDIYGSLLLGAIAGSHTLLAYPVARNLGITSNNALITVTGGTLMTDMLSLSILAGVVGAVGGEAGVTFWGQFFAKIAIFISVVMVGLPLLGRWFLRNFEEARAQYVFLMAVLFVVAYASTFVGLAPIVGGFLAGLVMNRLVPDNGPLMSRTNFIGESLFIPFFLLSVGMMVDFSVITGSLTVWIVLGSLLVMVVIGKALAAKITQWMFGHTAAEGWAMAGLSIPQAAATLAVTLIGYEIELFDTVAINAVVMLILITCLIGPWLVERFGREIALAEEAKPYSPSAAPRRIAIPLANPKAAGALMDLGFVLRGKGDKEPVYPLTIVPEGDDVDAKVAASERLLGYAVIHAAAADVPVIPVTRVSSNIREGLNRAFRELRIFTVIFGWDGRVSSRRHTLGELLDPLIKNAAQQLMFCYVTQPVNTLTRMVIMVPIFADREPGFDEAMQTCKRLADQLGLTIAVVATSTMARRINKRIARIKPEVKITYVHVSSVAAGPADVPGGVTVNDLIVLLSARENRVSWQPALAKLPRRLRKHHPDTSLIVLYPYELDMEKTTLAPQPFDADAIRWPALADERITLRIEQQDIHAILRRMLAEHFRDDREALNDVLDILIRSHNEVPIEVTTGVVLLHAHVPYVNESQIYMATLVQGQQIESIDNPVYILFVLLSPQNLPPKRHLENLSAIAQMVHDPAIIQTLAQAKSLEDIQQIQRAFPAVETGDEE